MAGTGPHDSQYVARRTRALMKRKRRASGVRRLGGGGPPSYVNPRTGQIEFGRITKPTRRS